MTDAERSAAAPSEVLLNLEIFKLIKRSQMRNGLKDGQYIRYRQYCTRRAHRIRTLLKITQCSGGRVNRYRRKAIVAAQCTTPDHLSLPVVLAERAWAYAMELQGEQASEGFKASRRVHIIRRLGKAAAHARELVELSHAAAGPATQVQAQAYCDWLAGCHKLELEDWAGAAALLTRADGVFTQLGAVSDLDLRALCTERSAQTAMLLSLCRSQLRRADPEAAEALLELLSSDAGAADELLQSKLRSVVETGLRADAAQLQTVAWRGHTVPVQSEKLRVLLIEAQQLTKRLDARLRSNDASRGAEELAADDTTAAPEDATGVAAVAGGSENALYNKLASVYDDAGSLIRAAQRELSQAKVKTDAVSAEARALEVLKNFVDVSRLAVALERNVGTALALSRKFSHQTAAARVAAAAGFVRKQQATLKPASLVTVFDRLLQNVADIETEAGTAAADADAAAAAGAAVSADAAIVARLGSLSARKLAFAAVRVYFLALSYGAAGRPREALALFERARQRSSAAQTALTTAGAGADASVLASDLDLVAGVLSACEAAVIKAQAGVLQREAAEAAQLRDGLANMSIDSSAAGATAAASAGEGEGKLFLDRLDAFDAGAIGRQFDLVAIPPALVAAPSKPFLFDIAANGFAYLEPQEDEEEETQAAQSAEGEGKSFWSRIWG